MNSTIGGFWWTRTFKVTSSAAGASVGLDSRLRRGCLGRLGGGLASPRRRQRSTGLPPATYSLNQTTCFSSFFPPLQIEIVFRPSARTFHETRLPLLGDIAHLLPQAWRFLLPICLALPVGPIPQATIKTVQTIDGSIRCILSPSQCRRHQPTNREPQEARITSSVGRMMRRGGSAPFSRMSMSISTANAPVR